MNLFFNNKLNIRISFKAATNSYNCNEKIKCDSSLGLTCVYGICQCSSPYSWTDDANINPGQGTCLNVCVSGYTMYNSDCGKKKFFFNLF